MQFIPFVRCRSTKPDGIQTGEGRRNIARPNDATQRHHLPSMCLMIIALALLLLLLLLLLKATTTVDDFLLPGLQIIEGEAQSDTAIEAWTGAPVHGAHHLAQGAQDDVGVHDAAYVGAAAHARGGQVVVVLEGGPRFVGPAESGRDAGGDLDAGHAPRGGRCGIVRGDLLRDGIVGRTEGTTGRRRRR